MLKRRPVSPNVIHFAIVATLMGVASIVLFSMLGRESLWLGEGETWSWSTQSMHQILNITSSSFHPPAYFVALKIWIRIVGDSEFMLRLPSATMFILSIPSCVPFRACHPFVQGWNARTAVLVATSPYLFQYAVESRSYMTLFFGGASALCCLAWVIRWKRRTVVHWQLHILAIRWRTQDQIRSGLGGLCSVSMTGSRCSPISPPFCYRWLPCLLCSWLLVLERARQ